MQKDFMGMAQRQAAQGQAAPAQEAPVSEEEVKKQLSEFPSLEEMGKAGLPTGTDKDSIKQRLLQLFEASGLMSTLKTPLEQQEFATQLDELVDLVINREFKKLNQHPLVLKLNQVVPKSMQGQMPADAAPQQPAPTDFSAMMPPGGGGMNGR